MECRRFICVHGISHMRGITNMDLRGAAYQNRHGVGRTRMCWLRVRFNVSLTVGYSNDPMFNEQSGVRKNRR